ncbi:MAG: ACP S-malonyltransferase, partial [Candidatus Accumulibacter sp.]|nr:ACP S-malonyltransferase [Accumulibacter sp.]
MAFAFVFPGQGSQYVGMMNAYGDSTVVRSTFDEASAALGEDIWALVAKGPAETLAQTINTQPVMLAAAIAVFRLWREKGGKMPSVVAGHSLGEYSALVAARVIPFRDAVPLVRLRALAMQEAVPAGVGAMAAILNLDVGKIREVCAEILADPGEGAVVEAVNFNAPEQTVIAGTKDAVERACAACRAKGAKRAVVLPV